MSNAYPTEHTPGPWAAEWVTRDLNRGPKAGYMGWHVGQPDTDNTVCVIEDERGGDVDADHREADAKLIAAAPDLVQALWGLMCATAEHEPTDDFKRAWNRAQRVLTRATTI